jgi:type II secretory pathway pseudopilin PulG
MSLVEATIILAVLAILTSVAAPALGTYMRDASATAAKKDVEAIGTALSRMIADVGEPWILRDGNGAAVTDVPSRAAANRVDLLVSDGAIPALGVARSSGSPDWNAAVDDLGVQELDYFLVLNIPSALTGNGYRTATNMSTLANFDPDSGSQFNSDFAWRGTYLPGPIGADPWGNRYAVNVEFLAKALGAGPSGNVNDVFVVSAGQNGALETRFDTDGVSAGSDDVVYVVSGGTR